MEDSLRIYLHDHLAGANFAIELLETLEKRYPSHQTGAFASVILQEVREDKGTLERIIDKVGKSHPDLKDATAWLAEKASRAKLKHDDPTGLGAFESMEALGLGIMGKLGLWRALAEVSSDDNRLAGHDYAALASRALDQFTRVDNYRLQLAHTALNGKDGA
jgi:hypothetical protein